MHLGALHYIHGRAMGTFNYARRAGFGVPAASHQMEASAMSSFMHSIHFKLQSVHIIHSVSQLSAFSAWNLLSIVRSALN